MRALQTFTFFLVFQPIEIPSDMNEQEDLDDSTPLVTQPVATIPGRNSLSLREVITFISQSIDQSINRRLL